MASGPSRCVLVAYYLSLATEIERIMESFEKEVGLKHEEVIVVLNGPNVPSEVLRFASPRYRVIRGSNRYWEFSGWVEGLQALGGGGRSGLVTLLNDSYLKNWNITRASRGIFHQMVEAAVGGRVAAWQDNFAPLSTFRFVQRPNSRVCFSAASLVPELRASIQAAICECARRLESHIPLFSSFEEKVICRWRDLQSGRWMPAQMQARWARIFIEHHLYDWLRPDVVAFFPKSVVGQLTYSFFRRVFSEKR